MSACYDSRHIEESDTVVPNLRDGHCYCSLQVSQFKEHSLLWQMNMFFPSKVEREAFLKQCAALLHKEASNGGPQ